MPKIDIHTCRDIPTELINTLKKDGIAMVDSEFTGLDVGSTGTDRLCLIQICDKNSQEIFLVQPNEKYETPNLVKVLEDPNIRIELSKQSNWPTIPQLFVNGELIGGCDIAMELHNTGELVDVLNKAN